MSNPGGEHQKHQKITEAPVFQEGTAKHQGSEKSQPGAWCLTVPKLHLAAGDGIEWLCNINMYIYIYM